MIHFKELTQENIDCLKLHEFFTYETKIATNKTYFQKGIKISNKYIIPIGLTCESLENAQKQN